MIEWPAELIPTTMDWGRVFNSRAFTSPFSQSQQIVMYPGAYWQCSLTFRNLSRERERVLSTFIGSLSGMAGAFRLRPWTRPPGPARGEAVVDGSGNNAGTIASRNWTPNSVVLRLGDYVTVNDQLLEVLGDVQSNSSGNAVIPISPWLRASPANGAPINYREPYAVMRLSSDEFSMSVQAIVAGATIQCREAF